MIADTEIEREWLPAAGRPPVPSGAVEFDLLDLLLALARRKALIAAVTAVGFLLGMTAALLIRPLYTATAVILPPQRQASSTSFLGQLGAMASIGGMGGALGLKDPNDLYTAILGSGTIADSLIGRFGLRKEYRTARLSDARNALRGSTRFKSVKGGLIEIAVTDPSPERAAELANGYVDALYGLNNRLAIGEASQRRAFFEQQLAREKDKLTEAEVALKETEENNGVIAPAAQTATVIQQVARLQAEITSREVQLDGLRNSSTAENPDVIRLKTEVASLRAQLHGMETARKDSRPGDIRLTSAKVPEAQLEYIRKERDVQYHQLLFDLLARQYQAARLDEAKSAPEIEVIDRARTPDRKSWPPRTLLTLAGAAAGFLLACLWIVAAWIAGLLRADRELDERLKILGNALRPWPLSSGR